MSEKKNQKKILLIILICILLLPIIVFTYMYFSESDSSSEIEVKSFEECVEAGHPVMESYPRRCLDFVEEIDDGFSDEDNSQEFYGSSSNYPCEEDFDCIKGGCNGEFCMSKEEEPMSSICLYPDQPLPADLGYTCGCFDGVCRWE